MTVKKYKLTGLLRTGRRFNAIYTDTPQHYNLWRGTVWIKDHAKWRIVKRINW